MLAVPYRILGLLLLHFQLVSVSLRSQARYLKLAKQQSILVGQLREQGGIEKNRKGNGESLLSWLKKGRNVSVQMVQ
jgi:hypothetical protein